ISVATESTARGRGVAASNRRPFAFWLRAAPHLTLRRVTCASLSGEVRWDPPLCAEVVVRGCCSRPLARGPLSSVRAILRTCVLSPVENDHLRGRSPGAGHKIKLRCVARSLAEQETRWVSLRV